MPPMKCLKILTITMQGVVLVRNFLFIWLLYIQCKQWGPNVRVLVELYNSNTKMLPGSEIILFKCMVSIYAMMSILLAYGKRLGNDLRR